MVVLDVDVIGGDGGGGGYKKRHSPNFRSPEDGISAKCTMSMIQIILFKSKVSYGRIRYS